MSDHSRTSEEVKAFLLSSIGNNAQQTVHFYDSWAETYEKDSEKIHYNAPNLTVDFLDANFPGSREDVQVLDVACGSGLVAKLMVEKGFKHFVGVDGCKKMLELAAKTNLYQDLSLALLGTQPLPAETGVFDVVILVGGLGEGFIPVSIVRDLCHAAKPGGLVCMTRGNHSKGEEMEYKDELERELQLMEQEGLWSQVGTKHTDRYMGDVHSSTNGDQNNLQEEQFISGSIYLYKKSIHPQADIIQ
ncbi:methyltransferase-like protein 27 [Notolabrus celidotus]|uniref:methyltransferase-like protein 27 n=1 Tax=Notolabrus celidotus TaxID=1203425 RepID=UPI00148FCEB4|nr:methyltransferase-like protein 27 [Notolabrus celidotus]XP_034541719.1 methyltransferase-like protein 27 [Notolabrus celidotus]XP_034541720.1 methyltransferase-like protein 27 [Notolabrus celidotus]